MSMIQVFNSNVSDFIDKSHETYTSWFGKDDFVPELQIVQSSDFNCGAVCNELEFARTVTQYFVKSLSVDFAEATELNDIINKFIKLPRRGTVESDESYRNRFKFLATNQTFPRRIVKQSILESIYYFISDYIGQVQIVEKFDVQTNYFQVRVESVTDTTESFTLDSLYFGWLDQFYLSGPTVGVASTYLLELIQRVKAAGVDFDLMYIDQHRDTIGSDAFIGVIQQYKTVNAVIKAKALITKTSNATITV